jgi:hypothetical protein
MEPTGGGETNAADVNARPFVGFYFGADYMLVGGAHA